MLGMRDMKWCCPGCLRHNTDSVRNVVITTHTREITNPFKEMKGKKNNMKIGHTNINGLLGKITEIKELLQRTPLDILGVTETQLSSLIKDENIAIDGYNLSRRDRKETDFEETHEGRYGGCLIYYKENLQVVEKIDKLDSNIDALWIDVIMHSQRIIIDDVYRHPKDKNFYQKFRNALEGIWETRSIIIVGDFNSDLSHKQGENEGCSPRKELLNILNSLSLRNVITEPTRIAENSETLIDLCIVNEIQKVNQSGVLHLGISDHSLIYASYKVKKEKKPPIIRTVKNFQRVDNEKLNTELSLAPWSVCSVFDDIDDCVAAWEHLYKNIIKEMVPEMKAKIRSKSVPWITSEIRKLMNKRYKLLKKFRQSKDKNDWDLYKKARNSITKLLREAEADYWYKEFREAKNTKEFWSLVRKVQNKDVRPRIGAL